MEIFNSLEQSTIRAAGYPAPPAPSTRTLRDRTKLSQTNNELDAPEKEKKAQRKSAGGTTNKKPRSSTGTAAAGRKPRNSVEPAVTSQPEDTGTDSSSLTNLSENEPVALAQERKPLPRVILKLGKKPDEIDQ